MLQFVFDQAVDFPDDFAGSQGVVGTNPAIAATIDVLKNAVSIGTISITVGGVITFVTAGATTESFAIGDIITLVGQATADASMADVSITLRGTKVV